MKFDVPCARSNQMVGISATRNRSRRALATSSMPISNPVSESIPTSRTKSVEYALNELVASRVPTRPNQYRERPARRESMLLSNGPPIC